MERRSVLRFRNHTFSVYILAIAGTLNPAFAQTPAISQQPASQAQQQTPQGPQQLDNLVAPIALYPDPLLGQMLVAATYPVELVEAEQWLQANKNLQGQQLTDAARQQNWDASVQALVAVPDALSMLTQNIRWTTDLGNAFLAQQSDVMTAVQRMRARAQANGQLQSNQEETVTTQNQGGQSAIEIQPADPQVIYVPAYDPYYVYGWGAYPPLYYPDGYWFEPGINIGFCFGGWGGWGYGGWGWGPNWFGRSVFVNSAFFSRYGYRYGRGFAGGIGGRTAWEHDPAHRLGAGYPNQQLNNRFGAASQASRMAAGRSGNWHSFGEGGMANRNSFAGAGQAGLRNPGNGQRFESGQNVRQTARGANIQGTRGQGFQPSLQRYQAPAVRSQAPMQRYQSAAPRHSAPSFQAPQRSFQSAPRMSAPSFGGGASRSSGGGGGSRSFGGGGGHSSGGGHGGGRR